MNIVALSLRNFKCYQATTTVPVFFEQANYVGYIGENGAGKSAILQGLSSFFTEKNWSRNKRSSESECAVAPIIVCTERDISKLTKGLQELIKKISPAIKSKLIEKKITGNFAEDQLLLSCMVTKKGDCALFDGDKQQGTKDGAEAKELRDFIRSSFTYVYVDAEVDIDDAVGVDSQILKFIKGTGFIVDIENQLKHAKDSSDGVTLTKKINDLVLEYFDETMVKRLQEFDENYSYRNVTSGATSNLSERLLAELIAQVVFKNRELTKKQGDRHIALSEMSSGQRRSAFLDYLLVVISSLEKEQQKKIILGIDEPEISVGASARIVQFQKLARIAQSIAGVVFTTHWYGWIQQLNSGSSVLVKEADDGDRSYTAFSITAAPDVKFPQPYEMRMMFDFLSSLGASAEADSHAKYVVCESLTDANYLRQHLEGYRIIPSGRGVGGVLKLHRVFVDYAFRSTEKLKNIVFLIDTDPDKAKDYPTENTSHLRRISRNSASGKIEIVSASGSNLVQKCDIEDLLSPEPLLRALKEALGAEQSQGDIEFINCLAIKYPDESGMRAFGLDDVAKLKFKNLFSSDYKLRVSEKYCPDEEQKNQFVSMLNLFIE